MKSGMIDTVRDKSASPTVGLRRPVPRKASPPPAGPPPAHDVAVVVYDGVNAFELGVVCEVFGSPDMADGGARWYRLSVCPGRGR